MTDEESAEAIQQYFRMLETSYRASASEYNRAEIMRIAQIVPAIIILTFEPMLNGGTLISSINREVVRQIEGVDTFIQATFAEGDAETVQGWFEAPFTPASAGNLTRKAFFERLAGQFGQRYTYFKPAEHQFDIRVARRFADELLHCKFLLDWMFQYSGVPDWAKDIVAKAR